MEKLDIQADFAPFYGQPFYLNSGILFYRGYDSRYEAISNRVTHFGNEETARGYAGITPYHKLGCFITTHHLRVIDYRYMQVLLRELFTIRESTTLSKKDLEPMLRMTLSYGLCSFADQINLMKLLLPSSQGLKDCSNFCKEHIDGKDYHEKPIYMNPVTPDGMRVAETNNDFMTLNALKTIFGGWIDGFVAPRMNSIFHQERGGYVSGELVLFDPLKARIKQIQVESVPRNINVVTIEEILRPCTVCQWFHLNNTHKMKVRQRKGGAKSKKQQNKISGFTPDTSELFRRLAEGDPELVAAAAKMRQFGETIARRISFRDPHAPHPTIPLTKWE